MTVWIVRHAAAAVAGDDPGLTDAGVVQARQLALRLAPRPLRAVWSSDSLRAIETARIVAEPHRLWVASTPALRELDFGAWSGRFLGDLWTEDPEAALAWEKDIRLTPSTFRETVGDLEGRVADFWNDIRGNSPGGEIAVVAHHGSLAALRSLITGQSFESSFAIKPAFASCEELHA